MDPFGQLPAGPDRADGSSGQYGTASGDGQIVKWLQPGASDIPIEELADSPEIEIGEQETTVHRWQMSYNEAITRKEYYARGVILTDSNGDNYRVLTSKVQPTKGYAGPTIFTVSSESLSANLPPDQFEINPIELGVNIIKYPRYFYAFNDPDPSKALLNQSVIRVLQNYFENTTSQYRDALTLQLAVSMGHPGTVSGGNVAIPDADLTIDFATGQVSGSPAVPGTITPICGTDLAKAAAMEVIQKYWRNEETPYIVGWEITWYSYYYIPQDLNPGGYIEDPIQESVPQLPDDFWSTDYPPTSTGTGDSQPNSIFDSFTIYNPQCYSQDGTSGGALVISWLRKADHVDQTQRTWIKLRRQWIGTPIGFWDADLYNTNDRPSDPTDYNKTTAPVMAVTDVGKANCPGVVVGTTS